MEKVAHLFEKVRLRKKVILISVLGFFIFLNIAKFALDWHMGPRRGFDPNKVAGKIVEINKNTILVKNVFGKSVEILLESSTRISKGQEIVSIENIHPGEFILANVKPTGEQSLTATEIKILEDERK